MPAFKRVKGRNRARAPRHRYHLLTICLAVKTLLAYSLERVKMRARELGWRARDLEKMSKKLSTFTRSFIEYDIEATKLGAKKGLRPGKEVRKEGSNSWFSLTARRRCCISLDHEWALVIVECLWVKLFQLV